MSLTVQDLATIVQIVQVCSTRNMFKLQEYTHVKNVYDYFVALHAANAPIILSEHVQAVADIRKMIEAISERGGFLLPEFETIHRLYQLLQISEAVESVETPAPSATP